MKVKFYCNSGANIHSTRTAVLDIEKEFGFTDEEWKEMSEDEKWEIAKDWAWDRLEIGYEEIE